MAITWNPNDKGSTITLSNGNLTVSASSSGDDSVRATISKCSGKWYWEERVDDSSGDQIVGIGTSSASLNSLCGYDAYGYGYHRLGYKYHNGSYTSYGASWTSEGDIIGVALDLDNGKLWFAKNGVWQESGDPAAGTNEAFSGISGTFFPMASVHGTGDTRTARFIAGDQTYSPPSGFAALNFKTNLLDGKVSISPKIDSLDGKVCVSPKTISFDGKARIKNTAVKYIDGKVYVIYITTNLLDGKVRIKDTATKFLDGKTLVKNSKTNPLDGKLYVFETFIKQLDSKVILHPILCGTPALPILQVDALATSGGYFDIELPVFDVEAFVGACGDISLFMPDIDSAASVGTSCIADYKLAKLQVLSYIGATAESLLSLLDIESRGIEEIFANGAVKVPGIKILSNVKIEGLAQGVARLGTLRISSDALHGSFVEGLLSLPRLHVLGSSINGAVCEGTILLPCLSINASGYEFITAIGDIDLGLLDIFAKSRSLTDETCWILKYEG